MSRIDWIGTLRPKQEAGPGTVVVPGSLVLHRARAASFPRYRMTSLYLGDDHPTQKRVMLVKRSKMFVSLPEREAHH